MQRRDEADQHQAETCWERRRFSHPCSRVNCPSIDAQHASSIDIHLKPPSTVSAKTQYNNQYLTHDEFDIFRNPDGYAKPIDGHALQVTKIADILQMANGADKSLIATTQQPNTSAEGYKQMKLDGVYYPLNDSISWLATCKEEMRQDITKIQTHRAAEATTEVSIDRHHPTSIDDDLTHSNPMKSQPDSYTRAEIDQLVEEIYKTLETTEERLDRRCDDIYFPVDLTISSLTSNIEAIYKEIVKIQGYIARRPEASTSIDRRNNKSTDNRR
uniref:Uncharacterized protein n=1 Tax=Brassica campestris TaxID=3711 RepID=M4DC26_BRACM